MSNLTPSIIPLKAGIDLSTAKMLAEPGSMLDCLNYETVDFLGYRRIDGFSRYDGNVCMVDIPDLQVYGMVVDTTAGTAPDEIENAFFYDDDNNAIGFIFLGAGQESGTQSSITYIVFEGASNPTGHIGTWYFDGTNGAQNPTGITQSQMIALEDALRDEVTSMAHTAVGLHWFRRNLYAVHPMLMIPYVATANDEAIVIEIGGVLTTTLGAGTALLRGHKVVVEADAGTPESGYLIVTDLGTGSLVATDNVSFTLGGAVSVGTGSIRHLTGNLEGMTSTACSLWKAARPQFYNESKIFTVTGWTELADSYTLTVGLQVPTVEFSAVRRGDSVADSTYVFTDGVTPVNVVLLDYFVANGSFAAGDATVYLQFANPGTDITTTYDMTIEPVDPEEVDDLAPVSTRMWLNYLPGYPQLKTVSSRYLFLTSNFYATEGTTAVYGVNGASRAFVFGDDSAVFTFIYTQADEELDIPRHVENHALHLALGFQPGSVQLSVVGQPTNYAGVDGASEIGVGDAITGLMTLSGTTLGVFCDQSIWSITGTTVDNFQTQIISPRTGCLEYTLANCGEPTYMNSRGISTLSTSANYGDFGDSRVSTKISSWLRPKLRKGILGINNYAGVACAIAVREKSQYRVFFNDGDILTLTLSGDENTPSFTFQQYFINADSVTDYTHRLIPLAWTSEVDSEGKERIFVTHYNEDSPVTSPHVFALECGNSFDGNYIPHNFTINWYFADNPAQFNTLSGIRMHGMSRGLANLKVQVAGAQNDLYYPEPLFSTTSTPINLPRVAYPTIEAELHPVTNRVDISGRGLAIQLKFSGTNTTLTQIEPSHVMQVLITYSNPDGAFDL